MTQTNRTTRVRPVRTEPADPYPCCKPVLLGTFRNEKLASLDRRHIGSRCAGQRDAIDIPAWRAERGLR